MSAVKSLWFNCRKFFHTKKYFEADFLLQEDGYLLEQETDFNIIIH